MPRKKPFSNKQKKKQLQVKREKKRGKYMFSVRVSMLTLALSSAATFSEMVNCFLYIMVSDDVTLF